MYVLPHEKEKTRGTVIRSKLRVTGVFFSIFFSVFFQGEGTAGGEASSGETVAV